MLQKKNVTLRASKSWQADLDEFLNRVAERRRGDQSRMIRQIVAKDAKWWLRSPYVVTKAKVFATVTRDGDLIYRSTEQLRMNAHRQKLPAWFEMKPEKKAYFRGEYAGDTNEAERIRNHWLLNHCAIWKGTNTDVDPVVKATDRLGICSKSVDMQVDARNDSTLTREVLVVLQDYTQRRSHAPDDQALADDRCDIEMKLPTKDLDVQVLVDRDLYPPGSRQHADADLGFEFRNEENALFPSREIDVEDNEIDWGHDKYPETHYEQRSYKRTVEAVTASFASLKERLHVLSQPDYKTSDGIVLVNDEAARTRLQSFELPESHLFGRLRWPMPYQGLSLCMTWNMLD